MRAMLLRAPSPTADGTSPLTAAEVRVPEPGRGEVLVRVSVCGVCRTDLDIVEGRLTPPRYPVIPGHQVIGRVERVGCVRLLVPSRCWAGSRRLRATAACCWLLLLPPCCHPERRDGSRSSRQRVDLSTGRIAIPPLTARDDTLLPAARRPPPVA